MADIAFIVGDPDVLTGNDSYYASRASALGYSFNHYDETVTDISDSVVIILDSTPQPSPTQAAFFRDINKPLGCTDHTWWDDLNLTTVHGAAQGGTSLEIMDASNLLAGGLSTGTHVVNSSGYNRRTVTTAQLASGGTVIARHNVQLTVMIALFTPGAALTSGTAVNYRVLHGLSTGDDFEAVATENGEALVDGFIQFLVQSAGQEVTKTSHLDVIVKSVPTLTTSLTTDLSFGTGVFTSLDTVIEKTTVKATQLDLILTEVAFSGTALDVITTFEGQGFLTTGLDALVEQADNSLATDLDLILVGVNPVFTHLDLHVFKAGVLTTGLDAFVVLTPVLTTGLDAMLTYGPDIDIAIGNIMAKWEVKGTDMRVTSLTREFVRVPVYAEEEGAQIDPSVYSVFFALTANDDDGQPVEPEDDEWVAGSWEVNDSVTPAIYYSQVLIGTDGSIPLVDGSYHLWWKINASTEAPVRLLGRVDVT